MNNQRLCRYPLVKLSLSIALLIGMSAQTKADTLYGPLRAGETLSSIVNQNYLVSPYEDAVIMREILRMNPQAFISNNMGLIKQGVMLTLPSNGSIRRAQSQNSRAVVSQQVVTSGAQTVTAASAATLTLVRNERDRAKLRLQRLETETASQVAAFNSRITLLESDKQKLDQQLTVNNEAVAELEKSLASVQAENSQLLATQQQGATQKNNEETLKQLEAGNQDIAQKQQRITELESSIENLKTSKESLEKSHQLAISDLQESNKTLEEKLTLQVQANVSNESNVEATETKIAELNRQHQQQIDSLQASFDAKNVAQLTSQNEGSELQRQHKSEISSLQTQHESEVSTLQDQHKQALGDLNTSLDAQLAKQLTLQTTLETEVANLKQSSESSQSQIAKLNSDNAELSAELTYAKLTIETLSSEKAQNQEAAISEETEAAGSGQAAQTNTLLTGPITKQMLIQRLEEPVALPFWGLLLGAFVLGFTSLMMLFTRSRRQVVHVATAGTDTALADAENIQEEKLVFRASDPALQDPDVETLRVPPRRDPSRVAILDPSMSATAAVAAAVTTVAASSAIAGSVGVEGPSEVVSTAEPAMSEAESLEAKFKLLIAETYEELGDPTAAAELLSEVKREGNNEQVTAATSMQQRLN